MNSISRAMSVNDASFGSFSIKSATICLLLMPVILTLEFQVATGFVSEFNLPCGQNGFRKASVKS